MPDKYYGVYLIPPPNLIYAISLAHVVLAREFNAVTGAVFMAHCTIKGFTRLRAAGSAEELIPKLDKIFSETKPFPTRIEKPWTGSNGTGGASVLLWMSQDEAFQNLHNRVWGVVEPHVAEDCLFTPGEIHGEKFPPHITLVQSDLSTEPGIFAQGVALCEYIYDKLPSKEFEARDFQFIEFESEDWGGEWWKTLHFRQLKGWRIGES